MVFKIKRYNYVCPDCGCKFSSTQNIGKFADCPGCSGLLDEVIGVVKDVKLREKLISGVVVDIDSYMGNLISVTIVSPEGAIRKIYVDDEDCYGCEAMLGVFE